MKKALKYVSLFAVMVCLCLSLTACGGVTGKYTKTTEALGTKTVVTYNLKSNEKCVVTVKQTGNSTKEDKVEGTYKVDGENIVITAGEYSATGTIKDKKLSIICANVLYSGTYEK